MRSENKKERLEEIRRELREIRKLQHRVTVMQSVRERYESRIAVLESMEWTDEREKLIADLRKNSAALGIEDAIREATELESRYMGALARLDGQDRAILLDGYLCGKPYWKIGMELGYSEDGVKKRVRRALERLEKYL